MRAMRAHTIKPHPQPTQKGHTVRGLNFIPDIDVLNPETREVVLHKGRRYTIAEFEALSNEWGFDEVPGTLVNPIR